MRDHQANELRQIKYLLGAILACLIIIVLAVAPWLLPLAVIAGGIYLVYTLARDIGLWQDWFT
jgi:hypothetical protein